MLISNSLALSRSSVGSTVRSLDLAVDLTLLLYVHRSLPYEPPLNSRAVQLTRVLDVLSHGVYVTVYVTSNRHTGERAR